MQMWLPFLRRNLGPVEPVGALPAHCARRSTRSSTRRSATAAPSRMPTSATTCCRCCCGARHEDGSPMTDRELRDELITLLTAGHETSATALAWAFERLLRTPHAMQRPAGRGRIGRRRLRGGGREGDAARAPGDRSTWRASCKLDVQTRRVDDSAPARSWCRRSRSCSSCPQVYPRRRTSSGPSGSSDGQPAPYTWIPFGGGVRRCLGAAFAQLEIKTVLQTVVAQREPAARPIRRRSAAPPAPCDARARARDAMAVVT